MTDSLNRRAFLSGVAAASAAAAAPACAVVHRRAHAASRKAARPVVSASGNGWRDNTKRKGDPKLSAVDVTRERLLEATAELLDRGGQSEQAPERIPEELDEGQERHQRAGRQDALDWPTVISMSGIGQASTGWWRCR